MQQHRKDSVGIPVLLLSIPTLLLAQSNPVHPAPEPRARDLGIPFDGMPGPFNAITDVKGVEVGYKTLISGDGKLVVGKGPVRTGVTAILPRGKGSKQSVFAGFFSGNGNGDMTGTHWIEESGVLETPILITNTNSDGVVRDAAIKWMVQRNQPGDFWYPVVAETADWLLNDIKGQHVTSRSIERNPSQSQFAEAAIARKIQASGQTVEAPGHERGIHSRPVQYDALFL